MARQGIDELSTEIQTVNDTHSLHQNLENECKKLRLELSFIETKNDYLNQIIIETTNAYKAIQSENERLKLIISYTEQSTTDDLHQQILITHNELKQHELSDQLQKSQSLITEKDEHILTLSHKIDNLHKQHQTELDEFGKYHESELNVYNEQLGKMENVISEFEQTIKTLEKEKEDLNKLLDESNHNDIGNMESLNRSKTNIITNGDMAGLLEEIGNFEMEMNTMQRQDSQESQRSRCDIKLFEMRLQEEIAKKMEMLEREFEIKKAEYVRVYEEQMMGLMLEIEELKRGKSGDSKDLGLVNLEVDCEDLVEGGGLVDVDVKVKVGVSVECDECWYSDSIES